MTLVPIAAMAGGTLLQGASQIQQGKAQKDAADANAAIARQRAKQVYDEGRAKTIRQRINNRERLAGERSKMAASGIVMSGSSMDALAKATIRMETGVQDVARAAKIAADNHYYKAKTTEWEGQLAKKASTVKAAGTLLTGTAKVAGAINKLY